MATDQTDLLAAELFSPLERSPLQFAEPSKACSAAEIKAFVDRAGSLPSIDPDDYDVMLTTALDAPAPWVGVERERLDRQLAAAALTASRCPIATTILARVLRRGIDSPFGAALELESLAYSTLLGGDEFRRWRAVTPREPDGPQANPPVRYERTDNCVTLTLASPGNRNAMTSAMRDALFEYLVNVLEDPSEPRLVLRAEGRCFSLGGALEEFGTATDTARAHIIRVQRSCARIIDLIGTRAEVRLHGACIGSGIEVPAAAARRIGAPGTFFQLPELRMGLIPGAGGTVTLSRAIGRHRLMWLALGAFRIGAARAHEWGLLHAVRD